MSVGKYNDSRKQLKEKINNLIIFNPHIQSSVKL